MLNLKPVKRSNLSLSKLQSPITTQWLHNNYELKEGTTLPRSSLYEHYLDFCTKNSIIPVNAASFGKIIRITFPDLKTRRLGTRGKSKYHYYGIAVKLTSPYYNVVCQSMEEDMKREYTPPISRDDDEIQEEKHIPTFSVPVRKRNSDATKANHKEARNNNTYDTITSNATLLPDFPSVESIGIQEDYIKDKVKTFLIMYRAHCQRILDTIFRANFAEVENFLVHFWQGMPSHIMMILSREAVIELIGICDNILYKAIGEVLIPSSLQPLPTSLTQAIQQFAKRISVWLEMALYNLPQQLQNRKLTVAKVFCQQLVRRTSLAHLAQAARTVVQQEDTALQMSDDLKEINMEQIIKQVAWLSPSDIYRDSRLMKIVFEKFTVMLDKQSNIEDYTEWLSALINKCVVKPSENVDGSFQNLAQEFLLKWSFITSKIIQELTLRSAKSFGSFHLLQMLFDDYIFYLIESHADISEEICDAPQAGVEKGYKNKGSSWSPSYTDTLRHRHYSNSSSGRGSLSPQETLNEPTIFTFPNGIITYNHPSNYNRTQYNQQQEFAFPYDAPTPYEPVNQQTQLKLPTNFNNNNMGSSNTFLQNFNQSNYMAENSNQSNQMTDDYNQSNNVADNSYTETNQSDYYTDDLAIVRQLQERTKSLMEATRRVDLSHERYSTNSYDTHPSVNYNSTVLSRI